MKIFKKPFTIGGFVKFMFICVGLILAGIGYAFGVHKYVWGKIKKLIDKIKN